MDIFLRLINFSILSGTNRESLNGQLIPPPVLGFSLCWTWAESDQRSYKSSLFRGLTVMHRPVGHSKVWGPKHLERDLRQHLCCLLIVWRRKSSSPIVWPNSAQTSAQPKKSFSSNEVRHESSLNTATCSKALLIWPGTMVTFWKEQSVL